MARVRMVTRTVTETVVEVMVVNVSNATVNNVVLSLSGEYKAVDDMLKAAEKMRNTATEKCVSIVSHHTDEKLYGMPETDFIKYAKLLPPRTTATKEDEN